MPKIIQINTNKLDKKQWVDLDQFSPLYPGKILIDPQR